MTHSTRILLSGLLAASALSQALPAAAALEDSPYYTVIREDMDLGLSAYQAPIHAQAGGNIFYTGHSYVTADGQTLPLSARYRPYDSFHWGYAEIKEESDEYIIQGLIDDQGNMIIEPVPGQCVSIYGENCFGISNLNDHPELYRYVDREGNELLTLNPDDYQFITERNGVLELEAADRQMGIMDFHGNMLLPMDHYDTLSALRNYEYLEEGVIPTDPMYAFRKSSTGDYSVQLADGTVLAENCPCYPDILTGLDDHYLICQKQIGRTGDYPITTFLTVARDGSVVYDCQRDGLLADYCGDFLYTLKADDDVHAHPQYLVDLRGNELADFSEFNSKYSWLTTHLDYVDGLSLAELMVETPDQTTFQFTILDVNGRELPIAQKWKEEGCSLNFFYSLRPGSNYFYAEVLDRDSNPWGYVLDGNGEIVMELGPSGWCTLSDSNVLWACRNDKWTTCQMKEGPRNTAYAAYLKELGFSVPETGPETRPEPKPEVQPAPQFTDVKETDYFAQAVTWAVEKGVTSGTGDSKFSPDMICSHAQILTFLWRAKGQPEPDPATVLPGLEADTYYSAAALWAAEQGLLTDAGLLNAPCTRSDTVTYFWKLAGSPAGSAPFFTDVAADSDYAQAVDWAVRQDITKGTGTDTFSPAMTCTRGQIVTFLHRFLGK